MARRWVFPIIRLEVFAAIAIALVKLAFFNGEVNTPTADPDVPYAQITEPEVQVTRATVRNDVKLTGSVAPTPTVAATSTLAGEVAQVYVAEGAKVEKGAPLARLKAEVAKENPKEDEDPTYTKWATVTAPASGVLSSFAAIVGQSFGIGDPIAQVAPATFIVSGQIPPEQLYRLIDRPTEAEVTIAGGPAPFTCTTLEITAPVAAAEGESASGTTVTCRVPKKVTVFAGLSASLVLAGGFSENALVVPTTAVEGASGSGNVYVMGPEGEPVAKPVTIGLSDGKNVEILDGLSEGDSVLEFVPGAPAAEEQLG
jgi:macrolide-specific efflux system membrane fusion protein